MKYATPKTKRQSSVKKVRKVATKKSTAVSPASKKQSNVKETMIMVTPKTKKQATLKKSPKSATPVARIQGARKVIKTKPQTRENPSEREECSRDYIVNDGTMPKTPNSGAQKVVSNVVKTKQGAKDTDRLASVKAVKKMRGTPTPNLQLGQAPLGWETTFALIEDIRGNMTTPVDIIGCGVLAEKGPSFIYQTLIAAMLSSQTRDQATAAAMEKLRQLPGGLTLAAVQKANEEDIYDAISKVGFAKTKAKYIKEATDIITKQHKSMVPDTIEGLTSLPGVGMKMGQLVMQCGFGDIVGICVDVHVHRICNKLGWVDTPNAERTRVALESWLPPKFWAKINTLLVGLGQMMQQEKKTLFVACLKSAHPVDALKLVHMLGCDYRKFAEKKITIRTLASSMKLPTVEAFLKAEGI